MQFQAHQHLEKGYALNQLFLQIFAKMTQQMSEGVAKLHTATFPLCFLLRPSKEAVTAVLTKQSLKAVI